MHFVIDGRYIQDHFPGIGRYTYQLACALTAMAPDETFSILYDPRAHNSRYDLNDLLSRENVREVVAPVGVLSADQQISIPRLLNRLKPDVYHSPYYVLPFAASCPMVVTVHDLIPEVYPKALPRPWLRHAFRGLVRLACRRARRIIAGSKATAEDLRHRLRLPAERVATIPYGVDVGFCPSSPERVAAMRQALGLSHPYVLYVGINKPHKNLVRLVQAWARMPDTVRGDTRLVLAGREDPRYPQTRQAIAQLGLQDSVTILGPVPDSDMAALYSGAVAFVFPSLYEGFGLPVLEAMACGTPVVASNRSSLPEVVGQAGLLIDPFDMDALAAALSRLLLDAELRRELSAQGLIRARHFSWEHAARETLAVYGDGPIARVAATGPSPS
jgi:glycosyltransferase involved in cell wall biosynthesis